MARHRLLMSGQCGEAPNGCSCLVAGAQPVDSNDASRSATRSAATVRAHALGKVVGRAGGEPPVHDVERRRDDVPPRTALGVWGSQRQVTTAAAMRTSAVAGCSRLARRA